MPRLTEQIVYIAKQTKSNNLENLSMPIGKSQSCLQQMLK